MHNASLRLVQLSHPIHKRRVALVEEPSLVFLQNTSSVYDLAFEAIQQKKKLRDIIETNLSEEVVDYSSVYNGHNEWKILPCFDHPGGPFGCTVSGTGLTHKNSALNRELMHQSENLTLTDSMKIYQWGVEGGFPDKGKIGVQPEWFYKGNGSAIKAHGQQLDLPAFGNDGGEEPEVAGVYVVDAEGNPWRIGFCSANEFSDHVMEKKNYLYLAPSKLRHCSIGPELVIDEDFVELSGMVKIFRQGDVVWSTNIKTGQKNMAHSLANLEYHHFKYPGHQIPLQAHIHFFGADAFSFGKIELQDGDVMEIFWEGMGRALQNTLKISAEKEALIEVRLLK